MQRGNPILKSIRAVPWEFVEGMAPDYILGKKTCALYLSVRYHTLNPNYVHERLKQMGSVGFELKVSNLLLLILEILIKVYPKTRDSFIETLQFKEIPH